MEAKSQDSVAKQRRRRDHGLRGTSLALTFRLASRFLMELLKQGAQRERRPEPAVRHDWYRVIARAVDLPVQDNGAGIALVALLAALPRPSYRPRAAWAPRARDKLPARPRTSAGLILTRDE